MTTTEILPTRIIKELAPSLVAGHGGRPTRNFLCDDGMEYTTLSLSRKLGVNYRTFMARVQKNGWNAPKVFAPRQKKEPRLPQGAGPLDGRPTRIIRPPEQRPSGRQQNRVVRWFACDDGHEYTIEMLAEAVGLAPSTIYNRLVGYGWESPEVLRNSEAMGVPRQRKAWETIRKKSSDAMKGNNTWANLGSRARNENLSKMRPLGSFERGMER